MLLDYLRLHAFQRAESRLCRKQIAIFREGKGKGAVIEEHLLI